MREAGELRGVLQMYEELLDKLTDQNRKLKDWIKRKKRKEDVFIRESQKGTRPKKFSGAPPQAPEQTVYIDISFAAPRR